MKEPSFLYFLHCYQCLHTITTQIDLLFVEQDIIINK